MFFPVVWKSWRALQPAAPRSAGRHDQLWKRGQNNKQANSSDELFRKAKDKVNLSLLQQSAWKCTRRLLILSWQRYVSIMPEKAALPLEGAIITASGHTGETQSLQR